MCFSHILLLCWLCDVCCPKLHWFCSLASLVSTPVDYMSTKAPEASMHAAPVFCSRQTCVEAGCWSTLSRLENVGKFAENQVINLSCRTPTASALFQPPFSTRSSHDIKVFLTEICIYCAGWSIMLKNSWVQRLEKRTAL